MVEYEFDEKLERLLISGEMEKKVQGIVRKVLSKVRGRVASGIRPAIGRDPRQAYRAVKHSVYKRILGGSVSILQRKSGRSVQMMQVPKSRHRLESATNSKGNHRGGNRIPRSLRTEQLLSYYGTDRGFVLRFLNNGTAERNNGYGNRGSITPRNFFASTAQKEMEAAMDELAQLINEEIIKAGI